MSIVVVPRYTFLWLFAILPWYLYRFRAPACEGEEALTKIACLMINSELMMYEDKKRSPSIRRGERGTRDHLMCMSMLYRIQSDRVGEVLDKNWMHMLQLIA